MAQVTRYEVQTPAHHDELRALRLELEIERVRSEGLARRQDHAPARSNVPWIVGGCLVGLMMIISAMWGAFNKIWSDMMQRAAWDHAENMAAFNAAAAPAAEDGGGYVLALLALAAVCIIIGLVRK